MKKTFIILTMIFTILFLGCNEPDSIEPTMNKPEYLFGKWHGGSNIYNLEISDQYFIFTDEFDNEYLYNDWGFNKKLGLLKLGNEYYNCQAKKLYDYTYFDDGVYYYEIIINFHGLDNTLNNGKIY